MYARGLLFSRLETTLAISLGIDSEAGSDSNRKIFQSIRGQSSTSKVQNSASEVQGCASEVQNSASEVQDCASEVQSFASKGQGSASEVQSSASKVQSSASKVQDCASESQGCASEEAEEETSPPPLSNPSFFHCRILNSELRTPNFELTS